jgi:D-glycero-D-manno-heptose 1,7-bisphosphate phosphatase
VADGSGLRPGIFLDRDGVINENVDDGYVLGWDGFRFLPGSVAAIAALAQLQVPIVVVTNQQGVGKGVMAEATLEDMHARMLAEIAAGGGRVDAVLYCPHLVAAGCECRKPKAGMLRQAADRLGLDLSRSVLVGDAASDVQAARAAGCRAVLVRTGRGHAAARELALDPTSYAAVRVVEDLTGAVPVVRELLSA